MTLLPTFAAVLFDVGARGDWRFEDTDAGNVSGKVRDPITRTVHYLRVSDAYDFLTSQSLYLQRYWRFAISVAIGI